MKINHKQLSHKPQLQNSTANGDTNSNGNSNFNRDSNYQQKNNDANNLSDFLKLPIYKYQAEIAKQIQQSNRIILIGETGCGKTTQVPKIIYNTLGGETYSSKIVITQPRRVAAISVSLRVSQEMQTKIGGLVGYSVRFDERSSDKTKIKYVTDGMLLREAILDNTLSNYNIVIIDEIHERSINTDTLLALILRIQKKRKDLKLVVMSATIDVDKLKSYLNTECVVSVSGRSFPIEVYHLLKPEKNYIDAACNTIMQIILMEEEEEYKTGDILVFLPGQEDIEDLTELLSTKNQLIINNNTGLPTSNSTNNDNSYNDGGSNKKRIKQLAIYQLFSNLPNSEQMKVFKPINNNTHTKIILATNIAETSLTIKNIKYVIDCGYFKTRVYDSTKDLDNLIQTRIYKNSAIQRSGRAGRESAGKCFRIYTHEEYTSMLDNPIPEILRTNLKSLIILIKSIGVNNLTELEYLDAPEKDAYKKSLDELVSLKAIDFEGALTELGKQLSILPVDTNLGKILINTFMFDEFRFIQDEILSIVALLQTDNIFYTPSGLKDKAEMVRSKFTNNTSDHITLLNVFYQWKEYLKENKLGNNDNDIINETNFHNDNNYGNNNSSLSEKWCKEFFINEKSLRKAEEIKKQLRRYLIRIVENADSIIQENELENEIMKKKSVLFVDKVKLKERKEELIIKCLLTGYVGNIAKYTSDNVFVTVKCKHQCRVHPSSVVNKNIQLAKQSGYIVFSEIVTTSKQYLKICSIVDKSMVDKIQV